MASRWVGIQAGRDPLAWARLLRRAHTRARGGEGPPAIVRDVIGASWERCRRAGMDPDRHEAPLVHERHDAAARWAEHPLARHVGVVESLLCDFARDARHIVVIADAAGTLLWAGGHPRVLAASERIQFVPGHGWSEGEAGTNGVGTALAVDHAVQVFSAEHYAVPVHGWACAGAPVHDPETGETLGVLDLSSGLRAAQPSALALVTAAARTIEAQLCAEHAERHERLTAGFLASVAGARRPSALVTATGRVLAALPHGWLTAPPALPAEGGTVALADGLELVAEPLRDGAQIVWGIRHPAAPMRALRLRALGRTCAEVELGGATLALSPRRSELLVLLALHPEGLTATELAAQLYGHADRLITVRAEVSRLRRVLGGVIAAEPYRLDAAIDADFLDPGTARGTLLPGSNVPAIVAARARVA